MNNVEVGCNGQLLKVGVAVVGRYQNKPIFWKQLHICDIFRMLNFMAGQFDVLHLVVKNKCHDFELALASQHYYSVSVESSPEKAVQSHRVVDAVRKQIEDPSATLTFHLSSLLNVFQNRT